MTGHADARGPNDYSEELSRERALAVRDYLVRHGVDGDVLRTEAYGEARPTVGPATTPGQHQLNRRVELRVVWQPGERPEGVAPEADPTDPSYVDAASVPQASR